MLILYQADLKYLHTEVIQNTTPNLVQLELQTKLKIRGKRFT